MKQLLVISWLLGLSIYSAAQTLTYDFSKGAFKDADLRKGKVKALATGSFATLKIINVNTFRFKVEIEGKNINYVTQVPSELQAIFRLNEEEEKKNTEQGLRDAQSGGDEVNKLKANIGNYTLAAKATADKNAAKLTDAMKKFIDATLKVADIKLKRLALISLVKQDWSSYNTMMEKAPASLSFSFMQSTFKDFNEKYAAVNSIIAELLPQASSDASLKAVLERIDKQLNDSYTKLTEDSFLKLIEDVTVLQDAMENEKCFTVVSPPIQINGDYVFFNIKGTPVKVNDLANFVADKTFEIEIPAKGGWKADFSVGPVASFGSNAKDESYYLEPDVANPDLAYLRLRDNKNVFSPGLAAMMHFYNRSGRDVSFGGMFGVGAGFQSVDDLNFSLYVGGSAVMGKRQKIILSAGASFLRVDRLKTKEFEVDKQYLAADFDLSGVTEKVFRPSFFFSISYNISNREEVK